VSFDFVHYAGPIIYRFQPFHSSHEMCEMIVKALRVTRSSAEHV